MTLQPTHIKHWIVLSTAIAITSIPVFSSAASSSLTPDPRCSPATVQELVEHEGKLTLSFDEVAGTEVLEFVYVYQRQTGKTHGQNCLQQATAYIVHRDRRMRLSIDVIADHDRPKRGVGKNPKGQ